ncbi:uncharacterized protein B0T15DRAFT_515394 [Chaetomium strumarium]|uniref:Uncharacterized protein n=1 Tax=Chaetomium strumarium TaxID=1170767 RepID=A0AAJ0H0A9_9PEZI|nr:hypothetical protein B0T15DRAFT_515394 [Chaetomium strumarium]
MKGRRPSLISPWGPRKLPQRIRARIRRRLKKRPDSTSVRAPLASNRTPPKPNTREFEFSTSEFSFELNPPPKPATREFEFSTADFSFKSNPPKPTTAGFEFATGSFCFGSDPPKPEPDSFNFGLDSLSAVKPGQNEDTGRFNFGSRPSPAGNAGHLEARFPKASLPSDLPTITSYQLDIEKLHADGDMCAGPNFIPRFR